jgi:hypothetical protein
MKSILDQSTRTELATRISLLHSDSKALWGKMNAYQMVRHCVLWDEMVFGKRQYKRMFIGRIIGPMALKGILKNDAPFKRNSPTVPGFVIQESSGDFATEKATWLSLLNGYAQYTSDDFVHPFFGKMTHDQVGQLAYKHIDHHLRQFGV